jgi:hypothetical protein
MDDEYYTIGDFIAHKSCTFNGTCFSNAKYLYMHQDFVALEKRCNLIDKITENINLPIDFAYSANCYGCRNYIYLLNNNNIEFCLEADPYPYKLFKSYEKLYDYISQNYPHLIKSHDIKIALKD